MNLTPPANSSLGELHTLLKSVDLSSVRTERFELGWGSPKWIEPSWLTALAALGLECRQRGHEVVAPGAPTVCYSERMRLFEHLGVAEGPLSNRLHPRDRFFPLERVVHPDLVNEQAEKATGCLQLKGSLREAFFFSLVELLDNAVEHSSCDWGSLLSAQFWPANPSGFAARAQLAVADTGIGIRRHLEGGTRQRFSTDLEAISVAIRPQVTGASKTGSLSEGHSHAGMGLPQIVEIVRESRGTLLLCSGRGMLWMSGGKMLWEEAAGWPGTLAVVSIFPDHVKDFSQERILARLRAYQGGKSPALKFS